MKILLTGGSGFLGSALARHFDRGGHEVSLLLRPTSSSTRLGDLVERCRVSRATADADIHDWYCDVAPDVIVHTACTYGRSGEDALQLLQANLHFGLVLLRAAKASGKTVTFLNTGTALAPEVSAYALGKQQFVQWGRRLADEARGKLRFVNLRLQHMYGPGDDRTKFTTHVLHACHDNLPSLKLTRGEQARDLVHIDDVISAYEVLIQQTDQLQDFDEIDLGSGEAPTIREFVEMAHELTGSRTQLEFGAVPYRPNEAMRCQADIERLNDMGWHPILNLRAGLQHTIEREFAS